MRTIEATGEKSVAGEEEKKKRVFQCPTATLKSCPPGGRMPTGGKEAAATFTTRCTPEAGEVPGRA
jgi:hypothetical protein